MYTVLNRTCWAIVLFIKSFDKGQKEKEKHLTKTRRTSRNKIFNEQSFSSAGTLSTFVNFTAAHCETINRNHQILHSPRTGTPKEVTYVSYFEFDAAMRCSAQEEIWRHKRRLTHHSQGMRVILKRKQSSFYEGRFKSIKHVMHTSGSRFRNMYILVFSIIANSSALSCGIKQRWLTIIIC